MKLNFHKPACEDYLALRIHSGMGNKDYHRAQVALDHSLFTVSIYDKDLLIAFGRVVGDEGITYVVSDIMVHKDYQRHGYGREIMTHINDYLEKHTYEDSYVMLFANKPADRLYQQFKFDYLPDTTCGMKRKQS